MDITATPIDALKSKGPKTSHFQAFKESFVFV